MHNRTRAAVTAVTVFMGLMLVPSAAFAVDPSPLAQPDYAGSLASAAQGGGSQFNSGVLYALLIPALWVGYKVVRRIIAKIG